MFPFLVYNIVMDDKHPKSKEEGRAFCPKRRLYLIQYCEEVKRRRRKGTYDKRGNKGKGIRETKAEKKTGKKTRYVHNALKRK